MSMMMVRLCGLLCLIAAAGCAASGSMVSDDADPKTGQLHRTTYSKYFDGGDWLVADKLGVSVVLDNDTPVSQQVLGGLTGKDSDGVGTVTLYFWNLEPAMREAMEVRVTHASHVLEHPGKVPIGPGPFSRSKHVAGAVPFFSYATELKFTVTLRLGGETITREIVAHRRTPAELKKYFGPGGKPPYPWFDEKYAVKP
jgi:hypothetical protein